MAMNSAHWTIDRATGNIRYTGPDHTVTGASYATVIQFHRWLQAFADDAEFTGDDELDIIDKNPSDRSTDNIITLLNGFNVTGTEIEHLYDGTIIQDGGDTRWDGIVNFGNANAHIQVSQNGAILTDDFWNYGHEAGSETGAGSATVMTDSTLGATVDEFVGYTIRNITDGSQGLILSNTATTVTVGELYGGTLDTWTTADVHHIAVPLNSDSGQGISHRFMVQTRVNGVDVDRRRLRGTTARYFNTYGEFSINGTSQGNNVLALSDTGDLNNTTSYATIDALADITNTEGLRDIDISGDGSTEEYYSEWDRGANTINTFFEKLKLFSADSSTTTLNSLNGEDFRGITHSFAHTGEGGVAPATNDNYVYGTALIFNTLASGPFVIGEAIHEDTVPPAWKGRILGGDISANGTMIVDIEEGTLTNLDAFTGQTSLATAAINDASPPAVPTVTAGRMVIMAYDDQGTTGFTYGQVDKGVAPGTSQTMYEEGTVGNTIITDATTITERPVSTPFVGVSTGSALIGAYGLGLQASDTAAADTYFDLQNNPITPPNTVTFTSSGFISGDYVLNTEDNAGDINFTQMVTDATLSGPTVTAVSVVAIPSDTPLTAGTIGGIRVERDDGLYSLHRYTSFSTSTNDFTIPSHDFSTNNSTTPKNVFVTYLDLVTAATSEQFQYVYSSDRTHFLRVRDGGATPIKTAESTGVMGDTGGTASIGRIDDT